MYYFLHNTILDFHFDFLNFDFVILIAIIGVINLMFNRFPIPLGLNFINLLIVNFISKLQMPFVIIIEKNL